MAIAVVQGARARTSWAQVSTPLIGREDTEFAEAVALEERWVNPLTLTTMKMKRSRSKTIDVHWWEDAYLPYIDQVNYGTGYNSTDTDITVDYGEYFAVGDLVRDMASNEVVLVTSISSDVLTVTRDFGQSTESWTALAASIADNAYLEILGNAFEPGHTFPSVRSTTDVEKINYCQDIRTPVSMTEITRDTQLHGGQDWAYQVKKAQTEHQHKIERGNWWGKPYRSDKGNYASATGNTAPAACGGINHFISYYADADHKVVQDDLTEFEFMDFLEIAFDKGSRSKALWCSSALRTGFDKWGISRQNTFETTHVLGMKISEWQSSQGHLFIYSHDMLKRPSTSHYNYAFVLDMECLEWVTFGPNGSTRFRKAGNHENTGETLDKAEFQTISCIKMELPNNHARLKYKTISV